MKLIKRVMGLFVVMFAFASTAMAEDEVRIVIDEGVDGARPNRSCSFRRFCT